jgi:hypothetical protein
MVEVVEEPLVMLALVGLREMEKSPTFTVMVTE